MEKGRGKKEARKAGRNMKEERRRREDERYTEVFEGWRKSEEPQLIIKHSGVTNTSSLYSFCTNHCVNTELSTEQTSKELDIKK